MYQCLIGHQLPGFLREMDSRKAEEFRVFSSPFCGYYFDPWLHDRPGHQVCFSGMGMFITTTWGYRWLSRSCVPLPNSWLLVRVTCTSVEAPTRILN